MGAKDVGVLQRVTSDRKMRKWILVTCALQWTFSSAHHTWLACVQQKKTSLVANGQWKHRLQRHRREWHRKCGRVQTLAVPCYCCYRRANNPISIPLNARKFKSNSTTCYHATKYVLFHQNHELLWVACLVQCICCTSGERVPVRLQLVNVSLVFTNCW